MGREEEGLADHACGGARPREGGRGTPAVGEGGARGRGAGEGEGRGREEGEGERERGRGWAATRGEKLRKDSENNGDSSLEKTKFARAKKKLVD
jgi:hypothetical protein